MYWTWKSRKRKFGRPFIDPAARSFNKGPRRQQRGVERVSIDDWRITPGMPPLVVTMLPYHGFIALLPPLCLRHTRQATILHPIIAPAPEGHDGISLWPSDS